MRENKPYCVNNICGCMTGLTANENSKILGRPDTNAHVSQQFVVAKDDVSYTLTSAANSIDFAFLEKHK